jgi:hypothetical protein
MEMEIPSFLAWIAMNSRNKIGLNAGKNAQKKRTN